MPLLLSVQFINLSNSQWAISKALFRLQIVSFRRIRILSRKSRRRKIKKNTSNEIFAQLDPKPDLWLQSDFYRWISAQTLKGAQIRFQHLLCHSKRGTRWRVEEMLSRISAPNTRALWRQHGGQQYVALGDLKAGLFGWTANSYASTITSIAM